MPKAFAIVLALSATLLLAADPKSPPLRPLRVATGPIAPFVFERNGELTGFSIDLWTELARRMNVPFVWVNSGSRADQVAGVQHGKADLAVSAIVMTPERLQEVDFSQCYLDSGLQIMVLAEPEPKFLSTLLVIPWKAIGKLFVVAAAIILLWANVLWFIELRRDPSVHKGYFAGIGESLWRTTMIIATGEHVIRDAPGIVRRLVVATAWVVGLILIAQLTATVTSQQTMRLLRSHITGPGNLPGKTVAAVPHTVAAEYLAASHIPIVEVENASQGIDLLVKGDVEAFVFHAPTLQYWAATSGNDNLRVVGPVFRPEKYGIAVPQGSPLRLQIDKALLEIYADGTYEQIHKRWFTRNR